MPTQKLAGSVLQPLATSCVKDYKAHSLEQTSFAELPNSHDCPGVFESLYGHGCLGVFQTKPICSHSCHGVF